MTAPTVHIDVDHGHVHITLAGEIDLDTASAVEAKIHNAVTPESSAVTVDLTGVSYIDSIGMRVLFHLAAKLQARDVPISMVAEVGSIARRVIELSGLPAVASLRP